MEGFRLSESLVEFNQTASLLGAHSQVWDQMQLQKASDGHYASGAQNPRLWAVGTSYDSFESGLGDGDGDHVTPDGDGLFLPDPCHEHLQQKDSVS